MGPRADLKLALAGAALLLVAATFFHGPGILLGRTLFFTHDLTVSDIWDLHYPLKSYYAARLRSGSLPFWCPEIGTGFPLLAEGQVGPLYPPNLLLFLLLPLPLAFNLGILLHTLLAGVFTMLLARELGANRGGALFAGVVFAFSAFNVTHLKHTNMIAAAVWAPVLVMLLERHARRRSKAPVVLLALAVMMAGLAGHPQILYYDLLLGAAWGAGLAVARGRREGFREGIGWAVRPAIAIVAGLLLAAPQLLPTFALSRLGARHAGLSFAEATHYDYHPRLLLTLLAPKAFGDPGELRVITDTDPTSGRTAERLVGFEAPPAGSGTAFWETAGYVGILPLVLAGVALVPGGVRPRASALLALLVASLLLTLGKYGGLLRLFYLVLPGFHLFRQHTRFVLLVDLALALLAGLGLTRIVERLGPRRHRASVVCAAAGAIALADLYRAFGDHNPQVAAFRGTRPPRAVDLIRAREAGHQPPDRLLPVDGGRLVFINSYYRARGWKGDLAPYQTAREMLYPDYNLLFSLPSLDFYHPLYPERMMQALLAARHVATVGEGGRAPGVRPRIASLFNVRYLLTPFWTLEKPYPQSVLLASDLTQFGPTAGPPLEVRLHWNPSAWPRAFLVPHARLVVATTPRTRTAEESPAPAEAVEALLAPGFDPGREVIIDRGPGDPLPPPGEPGEPILTPVRFATYAAERVELEVAAPRPCWLFLSDTFAPGWTATLDGVAAPVYPANLAGRAVAIPTGAHRVVFRYRQPGWLAGLALASAGALLTIGLGLPVLVPPRLRAGPSLYS